jgi:hypothetical protein
MSPADALCFDNFSPPPPTATLRSSLHSSTLSAYIPHCGLRQQRRPLLLFIDDLPEALQPSLASAQPSLQASLPDDQIGHFNGDHGQVSEGLLAPRKQWASAASSLIS